MPVTHDAVIGISFASGRSQVDNHVQWSARDHVASERTHVDVRRCT